jgi:predicted nucleic acid-binding protein
VKGRFVVDASIAIAWVHPSQATTETDDLLDAIGDGARFVVPALWLVEVANALLVLERRRKIRQAERLDALATLGALAPVIDEEGYRLAFGRVSKIAAAHDLTIYDAS